MRELVLILSDVYGLPDLRHAAAPALGDVRRYGSGQALPGGWRPWVARRVGRDDLAELPPAVVAATLCEAGAGDGAIASVAGASATVASDAVGAELARETVWLVTPVHLQAAMDHVRLGSGGLLTVTEREASGLAAEFRSVFAGSGLRLEPLAPTGWLLTGSPGGLAGPPAETSDPARALGGDIAPYLARGAGARALRALGTEIEMWLYGHALNRERMAGRQPPISQLWIWGGGRGSVARRHQPLPMACGTDAWLRGLWRASGASLSGDGAAEPPFAAGGAARPVDGAPGDALFELQLFGEAASFAGLGDFDAHWLGPALEALRAGRLQRLIVLSGDHLHRLARPDLWKFWRRPRAARAS